METEVNLRKKINIVKQKKCSFSFSTSIFSSPANSTNDIWTDKGKYCFKFKSSVLRALFDGKFIHIATPSALNTQTCKPNVWDNLQVRRRVM